MTDIITREMIRAACMANFHPDAEPSETEMAKMERSLRAALSRPIDAKAEVEPVIIERPRNLITNDDGRLVNGHYIYALEVATSMLNLRSASPSIVAPVGVKPCPCTMIEQDEDCIVGYPSMLCSVCAGTGNATEDKIVALAAEMLKVANQVGEPEDPFAAWETIDLLLTPSKQPAPALAPAEKAGVGDGDDRTEGFIAGYDEGLRQSKLEAGIVTAEALEKAKAVLKTVRRGALASSVDVLAALDAIDSAALSAQGDDAQEGTR